MGFTALDGLMMGTRCGSLDPGVMLKTRLNLFAPTSKGIRGRSAHNHFYQQLTTGISLLSMQGRSDPAGFIQAGDTAVAAPPRFQFEFTCGTHEVEYACGHPRPSWPENG